MFPWSRAVFSSEARHGRGNVHTLFLDISLHDQSLSEGMHIFCTAIWIFTEENNC